MANVTDIILAALAGVCTSCGVFLASRPFGAFGRRQIDIPCLVGFCMAILGIVWVAITVYRFMINF